MRDAEVAPGMTSGWVWPRWRGGGLTLETLLRLARVRRAGPPCVLGGLALAWEVAVRMREVERERLLEKSWAGSSGEGVWRW